MRLVLYVCWIVGFFAAVSSFEDPKEFRIGRELTHAAYAFAWPAFAAQMLAQWSIHRAFPEDTKPPP
jgi:hypothetical protein